ncbi:MAG: phosphonate ABC transporter substrate-binding protein [Hydrogenothermus sp.]|nr:MAG: phosphonate ABC transporter substrate-binding protein [Hydrogenothermus sp.]
MVRSSLILLFFLFFFCYSFAKDFYTLAVLSSEDPILEYKRYSTLAKYLSSKLTKPVKLQIVKKANRFLTLYQMNKIDIGIACPVVFFMANEKKQALPIAFLSINGTIFEAGVWAVRKDSGINSIKDLKGKTLTLGSSICASNAIMPLYVLYRIGIRHEDLIDLWSSGTDKGAILNVIAGFADGAGVNEESFYKYSKGKLKILIKTPYVPRYILFIKKCFPEKENLKNALFSLKEKKILKEIGIDGFVKVKEKDLKLIKNYKNILKLYPILK